MASEEENTVPKKVPEPGPFAFEHVLHDELDYIQASRCRRGEKEGVEPRPEAKDGKDEEKPPPDAHYRRALESNLAGLAFSGGGIRSATFNLGVLQGLAEMGLLKRFDYLSTVSGGGYIGSWLTALIHRVSKGSSSSDDALAEVEKRIRAERQDRVEDDAITFLRRFSNYLTPKVGVFSADAWTVGTTYLRNLILNLVVLVSAFALALLAPRLLGQGAGFLEESWGEVWTWLCLGLAGVALLIALVHIGIHFGGFAVHNGGRRGRLTQGRVQKWIVLPFLVGALLFTGWLEDGGAWPWWWWGLVGVGIYGGGWVLGALVSWRTYRREKHEDWMKVEWRRLILSAAGAGFLGGLGLWALDGFLSAPDAAVWRALTWGPPLLLALFVLVGFLQTGFAGARVHDHQREWLSRLGAWMLIYGAAWLLLLLASTTGTAVFFWAGSWIAGAAVTGWLGATLAGLFAGRGTERPEARVGKTRALVAKAAPYVFIVGLVLLLAVGLDRALSWAGGADGWCDLVGLQTDAAEAREDLDSEDPATQEAARHRLEDLTFRDFLDAQHELMEESGPVELLGSTGALLALFLLFGWRVDINEFSMHRLYRNRLVRAYLGASVEPGERRNQVQPFTGFSNDDILITELAPEPPEDPSSIRYPAPLHLVNTTLNLVAGEELAWQERKGASFVVSPLYSGFRTAGDDEESARGPFGYRRTAGYASDPKKLTLGSAFTISGAAASPNMGFRSSPALAFLLTVFNIRLGWWLGNPSRERWDRSGPRFGPLHLLHEVFGLTSDRKKYVYLSDGGHFENLGIYELVRRRCRLIVASDAGADPDMEFQDLGNAIRKCRTDLGIEVDVRPVALRPSGDTGFSTWHCAVGTIHYDRLHPNLGKGTLLYLKTSMTGDEPEDLHNYRALNPEFPHQSTGDQFFDESQFESYRKLGLHVVQSALEESLPAGSFRLEQLAHRLRQRWYPPSPATAKSFTRLAATMDEIFACARNNPDLDFLDEQFYPEWASLLTGEPATTPPSWLPKRQRKRRAGFYFCNELIQLMETVYLDLDLEHEHDHPDNRGWMNLFKHWSWSAMFRVTWAIASSTYGKRFVDFCERRLGLQPFEELACVKFSLGEALSEDGPLNFLERDILEQFRETNKKRGTNQKRETDEERIEIETVHVVTVVVRDPSALGSAKDAASIQFRCGFAALDPDRRIVLFRIQDHLRKMGLARRALRKLFDKPKDERVEGLVRLEKEDLPAAYRDEFSEINRIRFAALFQSVREEVELGGNGAGTETGSGASSEPATPTGPVTPTE